MGIADYVQVKVFGSETALSSGATAWQACACIPAWAQCLVVPPGGKVNGDDRGLLPCQPGGVTCYKPQMGGSEWWCPPT